jgi:hypothetical protein
MVCHDTLYNSPDVRELETVLQKLDTTTTFVLLEQNRREQNKLFIEHLPWVYYQGMLIVGGNAPTIKFSWY